MNDIVERLRSPNTTGELTMTPEFKQYRRKQIAELAQWGPGFDMTGVSVSQVDADVGSPKAGDMIARNPANHADKWLVAGAYFSDNFEDLSIGDEAADEIERMRAERDALRAELAAERADRRRTVEVEDSRFRDIEAERDALRAEVAALQDQRREMHADIADLAMLVKRLGLAMRKAQPEHSTVSDAAMEFLRKRGLAGEVLR